MSKRKSRIRGFTLLELLVVITILVILASAIIVAVGRAQIYARIKLVEGHLQLLKGALSRYCDDFGDYPPSDGDGLKGAASLYECLMTEKKNGPYVKAGDIPTKDLPTGDTAFADQWKNPIYYLHHHDYGNKPPNKKEYRLIAPGPNGIFEEGDASSDDIVNWNKAKPE
ncbi:MAG TPA: prepilin-type N-terminal cleavage/methylation domain-containing protein [Planctomycetota bacterium]|nr:prepilin-type N-terminal cleavage/methylation domain-containing protein [Planctomycetota bacterium]